MLRDFYQYRAFRFGAKSKSVQSTSSFDLPSERLGPAHSRSGPFLLRLYFRSIKPPQNRCHVFLKPVAYSTEDSPQKPLLWIIVQLQFFTGLIEEPGLDFFKRYLFHRRGRFGGCFAHLGHVKGCGSVSTLSRPVLAACAFTRLDIASYACNCLG
jgi:hypothetical protein